MLLISLFYKQKSESNTTLFEKVKNARSFDEVIKILQFIRLRWVFLDIINEFRTENQSLRKKIKELENSKKIKEEELEII